jgi:4-amino-4-deoxy-L-arabinose transferase-like glycosyltransferase
MTMFGQWLARLSGPSHGLRFLFLALVCLAAFAPGIAALPPTDRDESRFVQATKQMAETGDYLDIRFQDVPRYKKPIGIYWLQSATLKLAGADPQTDIWAYRVVSLTGGIIAVLATAWLGTIMFGGTAGLVSGILTAGVFMLCFEARIAKTDAAQLASCVMAQGALARAYLAGKNDGPHRSWILFWLALGAGILIKGPIAPLLALTTVAVLVALDRRASWLGRLRPLPGLLLLLLVAAPWLIAISLKSGGAFWAEAVGKDLLGKAAGAQESHGAWPGYYALILPLFIWPLPFIAVQGGLAALVRVKTDARLRFLVAWYVPWWLLVELLPTKLPHYILPALPALILAAAWNMTAIKKTESAPRWHGWLSAAAAAGLAIATLAIATLVIGLTPYLENRISYPGVLAALTALATGAIGLNLGPVKAWTAPSRALALTTGSAIVWGLMAHFVLPSASAIWPSRQIAAEFKAATAACARPQLASAGFHEPSLVVLAGTGTLLTDGQGAAKALLAGGDCALAAVADSEMPAFTAALGAAAPRLTTLTSLDVVNYSKGTRLQIGLVRLGGGAP